MLPYPLRLLTLQYPVWLTGFIRHCPDSAQNSENTYDMKSLPSIDFTHSFGRLIPLKRDRGEFNILT
jgi:hypothetical protein